MREDLWTDHGVIDLEKKIIKGNMEIFFNIKGYSVEEETN